MDKIRLHKQVSIYLKQISNFDYTAPEIQRNIENYGVLVDSIISNNRLQWVYQGQKIDLQHWPIRSHGNFENVKILQDTKEYLLLFKPQCVVVESGAGHQKNNLVEWLKKTYNYNDIYLVHRIDKDTQGLLLLAKKPEYLDFLQNQFRDRSVIKKYLAIVDNSVDKLWIVNNWQSRDKRNVVKQKLFWTESEAKKYDKNARDAKSVISPKFYCKEFNQTLIEIEIKTGRTHQIRLQCEALGFPISNDKVYNTKVELNIANYLKNNSNIEEVSHPKIEHLNRTEFLKLKKEIFGEVEYCLLSNYLKIQSIFGTSIEAFWRKID